jgi:hypothetical protein
LIKVIHMNLELNDVQAEALARKLSQIIKDDHYFLSARIRVLREILAKILPKPEREPLPPRRHYEPPRRG